MHTARSLLLLIALVATLVAVPSPGLASPPQPGASQLLDTISAQTSGQASVAYHSASGQVRFVGTDPEHPIKQPAALAKGAGPEEAARGFLGTYGTLFGIRDQAQDLKVIRTQQADRGRSFVRFQQHVQGVPVMGAELVVQVDANADIVSANGESLPDATLDLTPAVDAATAQQLALTAIAKEEGVAAQSLSATQPALWVYSSSILGAPGPDLTRLVWRTEVTADDPMIRELVLVDAHKGVVALHFSEIDMAKNREIYDNANNRAAGLPGTGPVRVEGGAATGVADADNAYTFGGNVYDYYMSVHGRDSLDGHGMKLISTVRYCPSSGSCPYDNAGWNGTQMVYGQGYASALDVVAHEMTHGVTSYESNLFYVFQSGAINESLSDLWGELVEHWVHPSTDTQWLMGEDLPIGAIRSMSNPPQFQQPDKMSSSFYYCGAQDGGGVHTNSGVGNKAGWLIANGGTFNSQTVVGLGQTKTAKIFYEAQANLLTSGSDYQDLYNSLKQACTNLVGTSGITSNDCSQVSKAVTATEMDRQPAGCAATEAPVCAGAPGTVYWSDNLETPGSGTWAKSTNAGGNNWYYPQNPNPYNMDMTYATSGRYNLWGDDPDFASDSNIHMTKDVTLPAGSSPYLRFKHSYMFEKRYDGGVVEYSTDGGNTWNDAGPLFVNNGYNDTLSATATSNPLAGRSAFTGFGYGYISSRLNLKSLVKPAAAQTVRFRFRSGSDSSGGDYGWFVDDLSVYSCGATTNTYVPLVGKNLCPFNQPPAAPNLHPIANPGGGGSFDVVWDAVSGATSYTLQESRKSDFSTAQTVYTGATPSFRVSGRTSGTLWYRVKAANCAAAGAWSAGQSTVVAGAGARPGYWSINDGTSEFTVSGDSTSVNGYAIYVGVSGCGNFKITHNTAVPIQNGEYGFTGAFYADGWFSSSTTAAGRDGLDHFYLPACSAYVTGGPWAEEFTWRSATPPAATQVHEATIVASGPGTAPEGVQITRLR